MATVQSSGVNLDVQGLVAKLVAADRQGPDARISRQETNLTVQLSGVSTLKGALASFQTSLASLKTMATFSPRATSVSDDSYFTATATTAAAAGSYDVEVVALAKSHQLASDVFASGPNQVVGTGTLAITVGSNTFNVVIDSTNNTVAGIRDTINKATGNTGVQASLVTGRDGSKLVLTSTKSGASSPIKVAQSDGDGGLAKLEYDPNGTKKLTELRPAQDAHVIIAGTDVYSSTNSVSDAVDGVTLNLTSAETVAGTTTELNVSNDTSAVQKNVEAFVTAFNKLQQTFVSLRSVNDTEKTTGALFGDSLLRSVEDQVRSALSTPVGGVTSNFNSLASLGITRQLDGTLKLDSTKFTAALKAGDSTVANVFASTNGIAARLDTFITQQLATGATFDFRNTSIQSGLKDVQKQKDAINLRMQDVQARYLKQFSALDAMLSSMQQTSSSLAASLASLPTISS
jgi:flagellar hook-associated protein 2